MKSVSEMSLNFISNDKKRSFVICDYVMSPNGPEKLENPILSSEYSCIYCGSEDFYWPNLETGNFNVKILVCQNRNCSSMAAVKQKPGTFTLPIPRRAIEWPLFCEKNNIGDIYHDIKFENIDQSQEKINYLMKFAKNPFSLIWMGGGSGTGKTFCCLGVCELYTRYDTSAIFITHEEINEKWLQTFKETTLNDFIYKIKNVNLLVVDEFGAIESTPRFMTFFLNVLNYRLQWKGKGTIINSNLEESILKEFCGEALFDRIKIGQKFFFEGGSRRKKIVL